MDWHTMVNKKTVITVQLSCEHTIPVNAKRVIVFTTKGKNLQLLTCVKCCNKILKDDPRLYDFLSVTNYE